MGGDMRFKKSYYVSSIVVDHNFDKHEFKEGKEFFSLGHCRSYQENAGLLVDWPNDSGIATVKGYCDPLCFCEIYRRQIRRKLFRSPRRAIKLIFAGHERMRRSEAERLMIADKVYVPSRQEAPNFIPKGYHMRSILAFVKSL